MKTVQEYLRQADRERLLDALAYDELYVVYLMECRDSGKVNMGELEDEQRS